MLLMTSGMTPFGFWRLLMDGGALNSGLKEGKVSVEDADFSFPFFLAAFSFAQRAISTFCFLHFCFDLSLLGTPFRKNMKYEIWKVEIGMEKLKFEIVKTEIDPGKTEVVKVEI